MENVIEFKVAISELSGPETLLSDDNTPPSLRKNHPLVIVLSPDCDLEWDYQARLDPEEPRHKILDHILLCDLYSISEIRDAKSVKTAEVKRIRSHQAARYHCLEAEDPYSVLSDTPLPELFLDFKNPFALSLDYILFLLDNGIVKRRGVLPSNHLHHLSQRFASFVGRVALP